MHTVALWLLLAAAILFFWAIGAASRLLRLRAAVHAAFAALDEQLLRQLVWMQGCLPEELRGETSTLPPSDIGAITQDAAAVANAAWARLHAASDQFALALAAARKAPLDAASTAALVLAHEAMRGAWASALTDAVPSPERLQQRWMRLLLQAIPLRAAYNDAAAAYNRARAQFPASILAALARMRPAGSLSRLAETPPQPPQQ